ncbi:hypothetical protein DEA8626_01504 [Defluviimonas aquaemixtae]|uniref:Chaperone protein Skp n=1 Tax=Albidovulum aquaemixtae TaxID=1542388 RepID=A0A2R8B5U2_9RHOB|nr:OmpH family outer membrane protein [Defluviimonas aquaemixtae]SPH17975.1 hypothetical protein DEA8626_01504 [Defluviimonas aquaemixtae]
MAERCARVWIGAGFLALGLACAPITLAAQEAVAPPQSPILTLDQERLFTETLWGKRAAERIEAASAELAAENRQIEAELIAEERALTKQRADLPVDEFRAAAEAFDARVTEIRQTQDTKAREIGRLRDAERQRFFTEALPVMSEVLRDRGAVVVLDNRAIFLAADVIDVTDEMIARIDVEIGAGNDAPVTPETPENTELPQPEPVPEN